MKLRWTNGPLSYLSYQQGNRLSGSDGRSIKMESSAFLGCLLCKKAFGTDENAYYLLRQFRAFVCEDCCSYSDPHPDLRALVTAHNYPLAGWQEYTHFSKQMYQCQGNEQGCRYWRTEVCRGFIQLANYLRGFPDQVVPDPLPAFDLARYTVEEQCETPMDQPTHQPGDVYGLPATLIGTEGSECSYCNQLITVGFRCGECHRVNFNLYAQANPDLYTAAAEKAEQVLGGSN